MRVRKYRLETHPSFTRKENSVKCRYIQKEQKGYMEILIALGVVALIAAFYVISVYNGLQILKTQIAASIQEIGNQLKRQASLIPNLQAAVKGHLKQEKDVYKMLTDARKSVETAQSSGQTNDIEAAVSKVANMVPKIQVLIESNPELKSDKTINKFMMELTDTADKLMYARRTVIDLTQNYNQKLVTIPSSIVASLFGFKPEKGIDTPTSGSHVEVSAAETKDPKVEL